MFLEFKTINYIYVYICISRITKSILYSFNYLNNIDYYGQYFI